MDGENVNVDGCWVGVLVPVEGVVGVDGSVSHSHMYFISTRMPVGKCYIRIIMICNAFVFQNTFFLPILKKKKTSFSLKPFFSVFTYFNFNTL